jgi:hypothetical protein
LLAIAVLFDRCACYCCITASHRFAAPAGQSIAAFQAPSQVFPGGFRVCLGLQQPVQLASPTSPAPVPASAPGDHHAWHQFVATQCIIAGMGAPHTKPTVIRIVDPAVGQPQPPAPCDTSGHFAIGPDTRSQTGSPEPPPRTDRGLADDDFDYVMAEWLDRNASRHWANIRPTAPPPYRPAGWGYRLTRMPHPPGQPPFGMRPPSLLTTPDLLPGVDQRPYRPPADPSRQPRRRRGPRRNRPPRRDSSVAPPTVQSEPSLRAVVSDATQTESTPPTPAHQLTATRDLAPVTSGRPAAVAAVLTSRRPRDRAAPAAAPVDLVVVISDGEIDFDDVEPSTP